MTATLVTICFDRRMGSQDDHDVVVVVVKEVNNDDAFFPSSDVDMVLDCSRFNIDENMIESLGDFTINVRK